MIELDLHKVKHADVREKVDVFIGVLVMEGRDQTVHIITGHSDRMKELVNEVLDEYKLESQVDEFNNGRLIVKI